MSTSLVVGIYSQRVLLSSTHVHVNILCIHICVYLVCMYAYICVCLHIHVYADIYMFISSQIKKLNIQSTLYNIHEIFFCNVHVTTLNL